VASIVKRNTTRGWRYDVRYRTPEGSVRTKTFITRKDALRSSHAIEADKARGSFVDPRRGRVTVSEYAADWLRTRPALGRRTRETYETQLRLHVLPQLGAVSLARLTPQGVRKWHAELSVRLGPNMVSKCYRLLRSILATAVSDELIVRNPCRIEGAGVERSSERPTASVSQVWALADAAPQRYRSFILLAGFCGLRIGELLGLQRRHVNLLHGELRIEQQEQQLRTGELILTPPKSRAGERTISLPPVLVPELERHLAVFSAGEPNARVFTGDKGGPLRRHVWQKVWSRCRHDVGLPDGFRFHDLRHTANTLAAMTGASTRELMHRMGHSSHEAALRYQHATRDRDVAVASALGELVTIEPAKRDRKRLA
jgi:integrase